MEYTVGVATESRNSKAWWGAGGVAAVGTGGVWGEGAKISYRVGNNIRLDKTTLNWVIIEASVQGMSYSHR